MHNYNPFNSNFLASTWACSTLYLDNLHREVNRTVITYWLPIIIVSVSKELGIISELDNTKIHHEINKNSETLPPIYCYNSYLSAHLKEYLNHLHYLPCQDKPSISNTYISSKQRRRLERREEQWPASVVQRRAWQQLSCCGHYAIYNKWQLEGSQVFLQCMNR